MIFVFWGSLRINNLQAQKSRFFNFFTASPSQPANFRTLIGVQVDGVVLQQDEAELIGLYSIARTGLKGWTKAIYENESFCLIAAAQYSAIFLPELVPLAAWAQHLPLPR